MEHRRGEKYLNVEQVKAKLESAKAELRKRYGEAVEKIKEDLQEDHDKAQH
jgi:hypothetical protein